MARRDGRILRDDAPWKRAARSRLPSADETPTGIVKRRIRRGNIFVPDAVFPTVNDRLVPHRPA